MGNALKRADRLVGERLKHETIGGEQFTDAGTSPAEVVNDVPTTLSVDPQVAKLEKVKAIRAQAQAFKALLRDFGSSRSFSISRQRIEEAVHWAVDGVINERPAESSK